MGLSSEYKALHGPGIRPAAYFTWYLETNVWSAQEVQEVALAALKRALFAANRLDAAFPQRLVEAITREVFPAYLHDVGMHAAASQCETTGSAAGITTQSEILPITWRQSATLTPVERALLATYILEVSHTSALLPPIERVCGAAIALRFAGDACLTRAAQIGVRLFTELAA